MGRLYTRPAHVAFHQGLCPAIANATTAGGPGFTDAGAALAERLALRAHGRRLIGQTLRHRLQPLDRRKLIVGKVQIQPPALDLAPDNADQWPMRHA